MWSTRSHSQQRKLQLSSTLPPDSYTAGGGMAYRMRAPLLLRAGCERASVMCSIYGNHEQSIILNWSVFNIEQYCTACELAIAPHVQPGFLTNPVYFGSSSVNSTIQCVSFCAFENSLENSLEGGHRSSESRGASTRGASTVRIECSFRSTTVLCVSHNLRLPEKIFVKIFRAVHRRKAERETVPSV